MVNRGKLSPLDYPFKLGYNFAATGCGAVRLARAVRVGEVVGSNPSIPTKNRWFSPAVFLIVHDCDKSNFPFLIAADVLILDLFPERTAADKKAPVEEI